MKNLSLTNLKGERIVLSNHSSIFSVEETKKGTKIIFSHLGEDRNLLVKESIDEILKRIALIDETLRRIW